MTYRDAPAFPETKVYAYHCTDEKHQGAWSPPVTVGHGGLTKREWFAGMALREMRAGTEAALIAELAVAQADALIVALNAEPFKDAA